MKKFRKLTAVALSAAVAFMVGTTSSFAGENPISKLDSKITEELWEVLNESADDEMIPVYIWINDIDYNAVESKTIQTTGFSKEELTAKSKKLYEPLTASLALDTQNRADLSLSTDQVSADEVAGKIMQDFYAEHKAELKALSDTVDEYIGTRRSVAREAYNEQNSDFAENYLKNGKMIFRSELSPMIICELPKRDILKLNSVNNIDTLSLYKNAEVINCGDIETHVNTIRGVQVRDNQGYDGSGVKVGQIESGLPKENISELKNTKFGLSGTKENNDDINHATLVAAIMVGNTGMAPKAELYPLSSDKIENFYTNVEKLVSLEVNVINFSGRVLEKIHSGNSYNEVARWADHIVYQHNVSWVIAAGNSENGKNKYIATPANAYNVIAVGGINDNNTTSVTDDTFYSGGNYTIGFNMPSKPDVVAPANDFYLSNGYSRSGTSFAAPLVTGMIAQMMQVYPILKTEPAALKAAVIASCDRKTSGEALGKITDKEGAGVVDAVNAINAFRDLLSEQTHCTTTEKTITYKFTPNTSGKKNVVLTWFKHVEALGNDHSTTSLSSYGFTNFDLYVLDSTGKVIASSTSSDNSVEMVRFSAKAYTTYTVEIRRISSGTSKETIALAHTR